MGTSDRTALSRARPPQVVLAVGTALLVTAAATLARVHAGALAQLVLIVAASAMVALSLVGSRARLRSSAEACAVAAAALGLVAALADGRWTTGEPVTSLALAGAFTGLSVLAPRTVTWPLAAWGAAQLAVLRLLDELPAAVHAEVRLSGVAGGWADAWTAGPGGRWIAAALVVAAGAGLVPARSRRELGRMLGPPRLAPAVAGGVSAAAVTGALSLEGPGGLVAAGWLGVALATGAAVALTGRVRGLLLPVAVAAGTTVAAACAGRLVRDGSWGALSLLLLLVALPPAVASLLRRSTRHVAVPVSVWCLSGSVLLALRAGVLGAAAAALLLAALYAAAMALGSGLDGDVRRPTAGAAALTGAAAIVLPTVAGDRDVLLVVLGVQALATLGWALRTGRVTGADVATAPPEDPVADEISAGWRVGAAHLTVAGWLGAALADARALEAWTLPLAAGLLVAAGPRLVRAASWPSWGPGLFVALVPSTSWAVLEPTGGRAVWVLALAVAALVGGAAAGLVAPLAIGAGSAVVLVLGLAVPALPWPLTAALVAGGGLLALGTVREWRPVAGFRLRLADLR